MADVEMVERVARALSAALSDFPEIGESRFPRLARAAIEALRDPPDHVLNAMNPSGRYASIVIPEAWNDAIDAILKEEGNG